MFDCFTLFSLLGWFRQHFGKPKSESNLYCRSKHSQNNEPYAHLKSPSVFSSNVSPSSDAVTHRDCSSTEQTVSSLAHCASSSSQGSSQSSAQPLPPALGVQLHLTYRFDVCVCHSDKNISQAEALVSFLEAPSRKLRCYLQLRDCPPGGAISTELCKAIRSSYCWVLLISPNFLQDDWCLYQMQQVLSEGPMSQRIIPTALDMHISELPHELRFFYTVDLNRNNEVGYTQVYRTVLRCEKPFLLT